MRFSFEGKRREKHAAAGLAQLKKHVDTLIVIPNDRLLDLSGDEMSMLDAFRCADNILMSAVRGISDIIVTPGLINVDFKDVRAVMMDGGLALMGQGVASGEGRALAAAQMATNSPLLDGVNIEGATGILVNITGGADLGLREVNEAMTYVQQHAHPDANIIFGMVHDLKLEDEVRVTIIATGFPGVEAFIPSEDMLFSQLEMASINGGSEVDLDVPPFLRRHPTLRRRGRHGRGALGELRG